RWPWPATPAATWSNGSPGPGPPAAWASCTAAGPPGPPDPTGGLTVDVAADTAIPPCRQQGGRPQREPDRVKTIRRRAASPLLTWESAGPNQEYRVVIRNQETGERQAIYDGFRTECRLPPELRLTPDLLAFRVMARPVEDPDARFVRVQDYTPIPRLGDDY